MSSASKMSSASGTQTPQSREHSERTASTDFSPEVLRFKHLSVSSDPFTSAPLSPEARPFEPGPVKRFLPTDSQAFETISDIIRKCPLPDPYVDLRLRMHHGNTFAQMQSGEPLTCFVWASGEQHISSYYAGGEFSWALRLPSYVAIQSRSHGQEVFIYYRDVRDAEHAVHNLRVQGNHQLDPPRVSLNVLCVSVEQYCRATQDTPEQVRPIDLGRTFVTGHDGQVLIQASIQDMNNAGPKGLSSPRLRAWIQDRVKEVTESFGDIKAIQLVPANNINNPNIAMFHIEFFDPTRADTIIDFFYRFRDGWEWRGIKFWGVFFSEDAFWKPAAPRTDGHNEPYNMLSSFRRRWWGDNNFAAEADAVLHDSSPSSTRSSNIGIIGQNRPSSVDLMSNSSFRGRRSHDYDLSPLGGQRRENKNTVSVEKIRAGLDVRTTIMLRNIPNRIDQAMLKSIVDQTSHGKYDFMYLRIDFTNNCNVGYAFINFQLPEEIVPFTMAMVGQKWANSDKVAEVSYATMQGRETLVQKFRNSSVMSEAESSRPKLFYTRDHPLAGEEEPFPSPDNLFKLARSNQNAAHIGLFSPGRGGASFGGFDRHRRGQYDRGTSFADMEELVAENRYLRTVAGLRRTRGGMNGGVNDRMGGGMVPVPMY